MIEKMGKLATAPVLAIVGAGAALANPGGFIPIALKDISELNPSTIQYAVDWLFFTLASLLPLGLALLSLLVARDWTVAAAGPGAYLSGAGRENDRSGDRRAPGCLAHSKRRRRADRLSARLARGPHPFGMMSPSSRFQRIDVRRALRVVLTSQGGSRWQLDRFSSSSLASTTREFHGEIIDELERLRESDTIRVIDSIAVYKDAEGDAEVEHLSNLTQDEAIELGSTIGALIGLGIEGEEGLELGAAAGAQAAAEGAFNPLSGG